MSDEPTDLSDFARRLAQVPPSPGELQRDALLFAAGRASAPRGGRGWAAGCALLGVLAAGLGLALLLRPERVVEVERVVHVLVPAPPRPDDPAPGLPPSLQPSPEVAAPDGRPRQWDSGAFHQRHAHVLDEGEGGDVQPWAAPAAGRQQPVPDLVSLRLLAPTNVERNP